MNRPMATLEPVPDKWQQDPIFFVGIIEERADMARLVELEPAKGIAAVAFFIAYPPTG